MRFSIATTLLLTLASATASAQAAMHGAPEPKWGPAPAVFPAGAQMAVMQGDPSKAALFTIRLRMPSGYAIAPHTHPTDEHVTVIAGTFKVGMGKKVEKANMLTLNAGGFVTAPANEAHYAQAQGPTIVQVHAMGPFAMTYVNPADLPRPGVEKK
ncbi:MAG: cupin domain-containing protein [bacterium]